MKNATDLRRDALRIWHLGVEAVRPERLMAQALRREGDELVVGPQRLNLQTIGRMVVVGAGKAGAGMAAALEQILGPTWLEAKQVRGWINVPADCTGDCPDFSEGKMGLSPYGMPRKLQRIHLHAARPAGRNEPCAEGVAGTEAILRLVQSLSADDLCLCLLSGGGSALLPAPVEGITLEDKLAVTRHLSAAGANIVQLNTIRKQLSRIKGGGLARACRAGRLIALIISDVPGDPLDVIASGPTVPDTSTPQAALDILETFHARAAGISPAVFDYLQRAAPKRPEISPGIRITNLLIGNNGRAVDAAGREAMRLGYTPACVSAAQPEGPAEDVGRHLADQALFLRQQKGGLAPSQTAVNVQKTRLGEVPVPFFLAPSQTAVNVQKTRPSEVPVPFFEPDCLISGGEPVVHLAPAERRGLGGRNQQLVLAALERLQADGAEGIVLLSGGTDGEDGPTDAAGAFVDAEVLRAAWHKGLDPRDFLARNDAYRFFAPLDALIHTGPTHTNVGDLRVILIDQGV
jgi:glycerate 2-kinase